MENDNSHSKLKDRNHIIIGLLIIIVGILLGITAYSIYQNNNKNKNADTSKTEKTTLEYNFTFVSTETECRELPLTPNTTKTATFCSGKITLDTDNKTTKSYSIDQSSHYYINGKEFNIEQLKNLESGKSKLSLTFYDKNNTKVKGIYFVQ